MNYDTTLEDIARAVWKQFLADMNGMNDDKDRIAQLERELEDARQCCKECQLDVLEKRAEAAEARLARAEPLLIAVRAYQDCMAEMEETPSDDTRAAVDSAEQALCDVAAVVVLESAAALTAPAEPKEEP